MCSICHSEPPINGIVLPNCGHIFCYLCIKSASETTCACAMCRAEIGDEFNFQEHDIVGPIRLPQPTTSSDAEDDTSSRDHYWFYEGFKGWWLYDAETNREIEQAHRRGLSSLDKYIAGGVYVIDFEQMVQWRKDDGPNGRRRRIIRATLDLENIIGMAGLKGEAFNEALDMMRENEKFMRNQEIR